MSHIAQIALVVKDYDEAIEFYTQKLDFVLLEDTQLSESKRWVKVQPPGSTGCCLLLAKASGDEQLRRVGNQTGGRVFLFLEKPEVEPTNNRAERALRPAVIARKVSHCSKTERGAEAYAAFHSVLQTAKKAGTSISHSLLQLAGLQ